MDFYISLETAKQLQEWKCNISHIAVWGNCYNGEGNPYVWDVYRKTCTGVRNSKSNRVNGALFRHGIPTYHLLEDICVRYAKEFFGEESHYKEIEIPNMILCLLRDNKKQEAEEYLLENTIFNPKNK